MCGEVTEVSDLRDTLLGDEKYEAVDKLVLIAMAGDDVNVPAPMLSPSKIHSRR